MEASNEQPRLITDSAQPERIQRIARLERVINQNPGVFMKAFEQLGDNATAGSFDLSDSRNDTLGIDREPLSLIREYFSKRDDLETDYDPSTNNVIKNDPDHIALLNSFRAKTSRLVQTGKMSSRNVANPDAEAARDTVRRHAFGIYLARVVAWHHAGVNADDNLRSTG